MCLPVLPARQVIILWVKSGSSETEVQLFFFGVINDLWVIPIWIVRPFLFLKLYSQWFHSSLCSDIVGTKGNNGAVAVLVDFDDSTNSDLKEHAAVNESMAVRTATETGSLHWSLKQLPGCGLLMAEVPFPVALLLTRPPLVPPGGSRFQSLKA